MNILKNRTVLGLICIILSLIICFGLAPLFNDAVKAQVEIVRMVKDVKKGEMITAGMVTYVKVGGHNLPANVLKEQENVVGKYAMYDFKNGDYILSNKVSDTPLLEFAYLSELDGEREAISITIKSFAAGLSGKLEAGDIVSVIASDVGDFRSTVSPPELRYVKVIAVTDGKGYDKEYAEGNDDDEKELPSTVTLLVVPEQAVILAELEATGRIHLALVYRGLTKNSEKFLKLQDEFLNPPEDAEMMESHGTFDEDFSKTAGTGDDENPDISEEKPITAEAQAKDEGVTGNE